MKRLRFVGGEALDRYNFDWVYKAADHVAQPGIHQCKKDGYLLQCWHSSETSWSGLITKGDETINTYASWGSKEELMEKIESTFINGEGL